MTKKPHNAVRLAALLAALPLATGSAALTHGDAMTWSTLLSQAAIPVAEASGSVNISGPNSWSNQPNATVTVSDCECPPPDCDCSSDCSDGGGGGGGGGGGSGDSGGSSDCSCSSCCC